MRPFLALRVRRGELRLANLTPGDVLGFVLAEYRNKPQRSGKDGGERLRSLLVLLHVEGLIDRPLAPVVPSVAFWRLQGLPRAAGWQLAGHMRTTLMYCRSSARSRCSS